MFALGVNTYSQIVSAFRAQGDLTDEKLTILPVLQNALGISRERHTAEVKRALYDEQLSSIASGFVGFSPHIILRSDSFSPRRLNPVSTVTNWETQANYSCPPVVHRPLNTDHIHSAERILQSTAPITIIQHPPVLTTTKLSMYLAPHSNEECLINGCLAI